MPAKNRDLHGNAPDNAPAALLLIDVINDMEYEGGDRLLTQALPMAARLATLKSRAKAAGLPIIYANDNFGRWQSDFASQVRHCTEEPVRGRPVARLLTPEPDDYFVLKPKHSAFFSTPLETLLKYLGVHTLLLTGIASDSCVLFTAADGFLRDLELIAVEDCMASIDPEDHHEALRYMARVMDVRVQPAAAIDPARLSRRHAA
jgi:nicotinamidase-related amidase